MCSLVPGVPNISELIEVVSVVDRFFSSTQE
ncbi:hypothetical protein O9993_07420 [Vibrio lentus]|nr:hypothetical protein [Vibrio lentus]